MSTLLSVLLLAMLSLTAADILKAEKLQHFALNFHNNLRKNEGAADMIQLTWSDQLAKEANDWAEKCLFEHQMAGRGENLAFDSNPGNIKTIVKGEMQSWFDEKKDFSWSASSCGYSCHYTQMVWAKTSRVGCAAKRCPALNAFGRSVPNALYLVCFYDPRGNFGNNLYTSGSACSKCPPKHHCKHGLCHHKPKGDVTALATDSSSSQVRPTVRRYVRSPLLRSRKRLFYI